MLDKSFFYLIPIILFSLSFHEFAHAYSANFFGDPTAKDMGRLSLNPFRHLNIFGIFSFFAFGFGWANPVPININNFSKPKKYMAFVSLAGPISNLFLAFVAAFFIKIFKIFSPYITGQFMYNVYSFSGYFLNFFVLINLNLFVFNLLPIPPLDGSRLVMYFLPDNIYYNIMKYEIFGNIILIYLLYRANLGNFLRVIVNFFLKIFYFTFG